MQQNRRQRVNNVSASQVLSALFALEKTHVAMKEIAEQRPDNWKMALVAKRREHSQQMGDFASAMDEWLKLGTNDSARAQIIPALSNLRMAVARLQSRYPISLLNENASIADYNTERAKNRQLFEEFVVLVQRLVRNN
jgi:hypothetical protein